MANKPVIWLGESREATRAFPEAARQIAGFQLWRVQRGLEPNDWKPMPSVGPGVQEVRIHTGAEHRVFYIAKFAEALREEGEDDAVEGQRVPQPWFLDWQS